MSNLSVLAVNTAIFDGHDIEVALRTIHEVGFTHVEFAYNQGYVGALDPALFEKGNADKLTGLMKKYDLQCVAIGCTTDLGAPDVIEPYRQRIRFASMIGARYLNASAGKMEDRRQIVENLRQLAPFAAEHNCVLCMENAGDDNYNVFVSAEEGLALLKDVGHPAVAINADAGNMVSYRDRIDPLEETLALLPSCAHCHLKDVIVHSDGCLSFPAIGQGSIPYQPILQDLAARQIPCSLEIPLRMHRQPDKWPVRGEEPVSLDRIRTVLEQSAQYVRSVLG